MKKLTIIAAGVALVAGLSHLSLAPVDAAPSQGTVPISQLNCGSRIGAIYSKLLNKQISQAAVTTIGAATSYAERYVIASDLPPADAKLPLTSTKVSIGRNRVRVSGKMARGGIEEALPFSVSLARNGKEAKMTWVFYGKTHTAAATSCKSNIFLATAGGMSISVALSEPVVYHPPN